MHDMISISFSFARDGTTNLGVWKDTLTAFLAGSVLHCNELYRKK